jgi:aminomethyltransferase
VGVNVPIKKTAFYDIHKELGAKLVEFAGYYMPIQYTGIMEEHKRIRTTVGLFDVSHMGEFIVSGDRALEYLQNLTINDVSTLDINQVQYSAMCYKDAGIVDDLLVYRFADKYMMVVNASNIEKDFDWAQQYLLPGVELVNNSDETSLLALQGPKAEATLEKITAINLASIPYYWSVTGTVAGVDMILSRTGYTGEPGFEMYFQNQFAGKVWGALMDAGKEYEIAPVGLGARDTLRLEMKYCLYGNDIDETTNPIEAGLGWITKVDKGEFIGRNRIVAEKENGPIRRLIAFEVEGKGFPRHGYKIYSKDKEIGTVASGTFSPMLEKGIGMGYVSKECSKIGSNIEISIRNQKIPAQIIRPPFYKKYQ